MTISLPTEKQSPSITPASAKILLFGAEGVGKTSLAAALDPEHTLILATEPGTGGLEAYVQPIKSWQEFLDYGALLAKGDHHYTTVIVDTADELQRMCQEHVIAQWNDGKPKGAHITHPSDLEYGKGWDALAREWRRLAGFCSLGFGVIFTSHAKEEEIKKPVGVVMKAVPTLTGSAAKWLRGYVEFIFYEAVERVGDKEQRVLHTQPSETWTAKQRVPEDGRPLPDPIVLGSSPSEGAAALLAAMEAATQKPVAA